MAILTSNIGARWVEGEKGSNPRERTEIYLVGFPMTGFVVFAGALFLQVCIHRYDVRISLLLSDTRRQQRRL